jgi:hypothetical protein
MLNTAYFEKNAAIIENILDNIYTAHATTPQDPTNLTTWREQATI